MTELINTFSWSISAREDFAECRRRRYFAKYAMWNGWNENASPLQRAAYRLSKMENRFTLLGNAVERGVNWLVREQQSGRAATAEEAYAAAAKPFLNRCWSESLAGSWKTNPKKFCCLHEHYYAGPERNGEKEKAMTAAMIVRIKICLSNFISKILPGLAPVKPEQEINVRGVAQGDPESFDCEGIKIYAIPDYAYLREGGMHIHDWKSGSPKPAHADQMAVYGLWAALKHKIAPEKVNIHLEYLAAGVTESRRLAEKNLVEARDLIRASVREMAEYLADGDLRRNEPLPKEDWEMCADINTCRRCHFYELCRPELEG
jgi:hypothetical protein